MVWFRLMCKSAEIIVFIVNRLQKDTVLQQKTIPKNILDSSYI